MLAQNNDAIEKGLFSRGLRQGRQEGLQQGELMTLIKLVCRKVQKGNTPQEIADILEEDWKQFNRFAMLQRTVETDTLQKRFTTN